MTMQLKGANILVTGGFGFIGSNLAIKLVSLGSNVTIVDSLDKNCGGNTYNIEPIKNFVKIDNEASPPPLSFNACPQCLALVAQRIERHTPNVDIQVQFLSRAHGLFFKGFVLIMVIIE